MACAWAEIIRAEAATPMPNILVSALIFMWFPPWVIPSALQRRRDAVSKKAFKQNYAGDALCSRLLTSATHVGDRAHRRRRADSSWREPYRFLKRRRNENCDFAKNICESNSCAQADGQPERDVKLHFGKFCATAWSFGSSPASVA